MSRRFALTIDCHRPGPLVAFWCAALGYVPEPPPAGAASWVEHWRAMGVPEHELVDVEGAESVVDPDGIGPRIWFQVVPEDKVVKNRVHLDLDVTSGRSEPVAERRRVVDLEADRLIALGATRLAVLDTYEDHYGQTLADPEGNEFCLS